MAPLALWLLLVSLGRGWVEAGVGGVPTFRLGNGTPGNVKATMPRTNMKSLLSSRSHAFNQARQQGAKLGYS